jgi:hypothetical protein
MKRDASNVSADYLWEKIYETEASENNLCEETMLESPPAANDNYVEHESRSANSNQQEIEEQEQETQIERPFPKLHPMARHGLIGRILKVIEPETEADAVAVLVQLLAALGNIIGRSPYFIVEGAIHHTNIYAILVGQSAKGRKGTSWRHVLNICKEVEKGWVDECTASGLSSGEGVIWAVRDAIYKPERDTKTGEVKEVKVDNGIDDKRLFVTEEEFAQALKVMSRPTNILSVIIRSAWDTGDLRTLVKNNPTRATGAHITICGHITREELKRELTQCDLFNGFANRFLWVAVRRSKCLPEGGRMSKEANKSIGGELSHIVGKARNISEMTRSQEARTHWHEIYSSLSQEAHGLAGSVINRAEAQVLRLSMLYALADASPVIKLDHQKAALALWNYCRDSAYYLFGDRLSDPNAEAILQALKRHPEGLTRKEIFDLVFQKNITGRVLAEAFENLEKSGFVKKEVQQTGGRPAERWLLLRGSTS